jgi:hypothetical protein
MPEFDHNSFDVSSRKANNPWESVQGERSNVDAPPRKSLTDIPLVRIIAIILLAAILIYFLYTVLLHPIHKLNLRLLFAKHCIIKVTATAYAFIGSKSEYYTLILYLDQNAFAIGEGYPNAKNLKYYKLVGEELYTYNEESGEWYEADESDDEESLFADGMFKRKNYKWAKGKLFVWRYKDSDMYFKHRFGKFTFTQKYGYGEVVLEFKRISMRHLEAPWEK